MKRRAFVSTSLAIGAAAIATPAAADKATEERNIATVRRFFSEFRSSRNPEAARGVVAPDYSYPPDPNAAPGIDAFIARSVQYFDSINRDFTSYEWIEEAVMSQGDGVVWRGFEKGTTTQGRSTNVVNVTWFELNDDGLIVHLWGGIDNGELTSQMFGR